MSERYDAPSSPRKPSATLPLGSHLKPHDDPVMTRLAITLQFSLTGFKGFLGNFAQCVVVSRLLAGYTSALLDRIDALRSQGAPAVGFVPCFFQGNVRQAPRDPPLRRACPPGQSLRNRMKACAYPPFYIPFLIPHNI